MQPEEPPGRFVPNDEVDEIVWCSIADAAAALSYEHDRALVVGLRV
jgi:hypothetical protein